MTASDTQQKIAHLTFIQNAIARMANNGILCKVLSIVMVTLYLVFSTRYNFIACNALIITVMLLDAFYLKQERTFRSLYSLHRDNESTPDFYMNLGEYPLAEPISYLQSLYSLTVLPLYFSLSIIVYLPLLNIRPFS